MVARMDLVEATRPDAAVSPLPPKSPWEEGKLTSARVPFLSLPLVRCSSSSRGVRPFVSTTRRSLLTSSSGSCCARPMSGGGWAGSRR